jgi:hypothetical protein
VPSKVYYIRALVILLVFSGWFFLFRSDAAVKKPITYERPELLSVQSRQLSVQSDASKFQEASDTPEQQQEAVNAYLKINNANYTNASIAVLDNDKSQDKEAIKNYGLEIKTALAPFENPNRQNEVELMLAALEKGNEVKAHTELAALGGIKNGYDTVLKNLSKIQVPASAEQMQIDLMNTTANLSQLTANMTNVLTDPIRAVQSGEDYKKEEQKLVDIFQSINKYFLDAGIKFDDKEKATVTIYEIK